jgi:hypothetical protein
MSISASSASYEAYITYIYTIYTHRAKGAQLVDKGREREDPLTDGWIER